MKFSELNLKETTLKAIQAMGFESPTEIQAKAIPPLIEKDQDFVGQAQTGTGKTAAFVIPLLERMDLSNKNVQALIIAPTRELANQIKEEIDKLSKFEPVKAVCVYGGVSAQGQIRDIKRFKPQFIVGTAGRLKDLIDRRALNIKEVKHVVLDEADEMLDMGFFEDINYIMDKVDEKKTWMFSATMPKPILNMINKHFNTPLNIAVKKKELTADSVDQKYLVVRGSDKTEALCRYLDFSSNVYAIVFCRTKIGTQELTERLNSRGYAADAMHGDMSQDARDITMRKFKDKKITLLCCTDVAARGIDVNDLTHVINYELPQDNESYVHRIGRTGRAGNKGIALSIIDPRDESKIGHIERKTKAKIERIKVPTVESITTKLIEKSCVDFEMSIATFEENEGFANFKERFEGAQAEDLLKGVYRFLFDSTLKRYNNAKEINLEKSTRSEGKNRANSGFERFHITVGRMDKLDVPSVIRFVCDNAKITGAEIGRIDLKESFSFFEVKKDYAEQILALSGQTLNNRTATIQISKSDDGGGRGGRSGGRSGGRGNYGRSRDGAASAGGANRSGRRPSARRSTTSRDRSAPST
jgi:ATP-dependent RNA helicase DeaD